MMYVAIAGIACGGPPRFEVSFPADVRAEPVSGRLLVFLEKQGARKMGRGEPADGINYFDPQPIFGIDVTDMKPGQKIVVDDSADAFPSPLSRLPPGSYTAQALLDHQQVSGEWRREPGNLFSKPVDFTLASESGGANALTPPAAVFELTEVSISQRMEELPQIEFFERRSELLTTSLGAPVVLRAAVISPADQGSGKLPTVYVVPGFGGDHRLALQILQLKQRQTPHPFQIQATFVVLDPDSANGHTLFVDSDNNGPRGEALARELIPALEAEYPLIADPSARVVTGHSSGGWSSVWLALNYPDVFGACFSGAPDPLDFHAFQKVNLYKDENFYVDAAGNEHPSNLMNGKVLMTIRQENQWEEVRGPGNSAGQQWDSWQAAFGPRDEKGRPAALFDPMTGAIDRKVVERFERYDIVKLFENNPEKYGPIFAERIWITVGGADEWNLHAGVELLKKSLNAKGIPMDGKASFGRIDIVHGANHGSVVGSREYQTMLEGIRAFFQRHGHIPKP